jgi:hypothetical protein
MQWQWRKVFILGFDVTGRRCRVAQVSVPARCMTRGQMVDYLRASNPERYAQLTENDIDVFA